MNGSSPSADWSPNRYRFADLRLETDGTLWRGALELKLATEELAVLRLLLRNAGEILSPLELKRAVWCEEHISSDIVAICIASLREHLRPTVLIENVYKRGYRVSIPVRTGDTLPAGALPRLAIVPFAVCFGVPDYLGSAIAEGAAAQLSGPEFAAAAEVPRDSIVTLAGRGFSALEIGRRLAADLVLTGELRSTPEQLRLRATMTRVADGAELWIDDLMMKRGRIKRLEWELVHRVSSRLHLDGLSIAAVGSPAIQPGVTPEHAEAHELYLRAHHEWQTLERHHMQDAMGRLQRAIELDPSLIAARADLAHLSVTQALYGFMPATAAASMVRRAAAQIPESAGNAETLLPVLGWIRFHVDRDLSAALDAFARSAHLAHDPCVTRLRTMILLSRHRYDEALETLRMAIQADPYSPWLQAEMAWALHLAGEAEASVDQARKAISQHGGHDEAHFYGAMILAYNGEAARAVELGCALALRSAHFDLGMSAHAYALARAERKEEARTLLERLKWLSRERFVMTTFDAATYVAMDGDDAALEVLRIANENRCPWFFQMLGDPRLQPLRGRPEFERMRSSLRAMEAIGASKAEYGEEPGWVVEQAG